MADTTQVADVVTPIPAFEDIERVTRFTREPFLAEGEDPAVSLGPGSARRWALDAALAELDAGAKVPSLAWRQRWSLLLGLDRLLAMEEPVLVDGTVLSAHQVDALSGTLTELLAEAQAARDAATDGALPELNGALASSGIPGEEDLDEDEPEEPQDWDGRGEVDADALIVEEQPEDPNAARRFWFEHATGAGKTVAALGFVEASRTGGTLILTHRRNLVDQFHGELRDRGYRDRIAPALLRGQDRADGPVTVETYQWFVRNAGNVSDAYTIVICDEAHTALGDKTSAAIRNWSGPVFIGMTATGALIARHVTDLFPTQTSRFDLAQAARRGVIAPLRCVRIPPGPGVRTIAKVPLRKGEVDMEFDQEMLAELLDQLPFNLAIADLYKTRFNGVPGVVYSAGVRHAYNVAQAFRDVGLKAQAVSGETPKRELAQILARYEHGDIDVLVNAQLLAEGWNSPRATVCMHLAPTASKRIYQQRVGRVTRRHPGKEAGIVVDFVHPATKHDDPVVTLHSLLDRDVYRGGAIVVGPVRRGRGRRLRVERRVLPVTADENRRIEVFERELWRIAVEHLDYGEQVQWAALAGARVAPTGWRRARAMLHFDSGGELKRTFLLTAVQRNKNPALRLRALQEIAASRDAEAFDDAIEMIGGWPRDEKREGVKVVLQALADKKIGRRDQANNWIWHCAEYTRDVHEEYAVQRWPETKRLLGLLVNSSGGAHARNARRLVHAARQQDRRLAAALLAAAIPHTAEAGEVVNGARTRMSRKPAALARELLRNFPKGRGKRGRRRRKKSVGESQVEAVVAATEAAVDETVEDVEVEEEGVEEAVVAATPARTRRRRVVQADETEEAAGEEETPKPRRTRRKPAETAPGEVAKPRRTRRTVTEETAPEPLSPLLAAAAAVEAAARGESPPFAKATIEPPAEETPSRPRRTRPTTVTPAVAEAPEAAPTARRARRTSATPVDAEVPADVATPADAEAPPEAAPKPRRSRRTAAQVVGDEAPESAPKPRRARRTATQEDGDTPEAAPKPRRSRRTAAQVAGDEAPEAAPKPRRSRRTATQEDGDTPEAAPKPARSRRTAAQVAGDEAPESEPKPRRSRRTAAQVAGDEAPESEPKPRRTRRTATPEDGDTPEAAPKPRRSRRTATQEDGDKPEAAPKPRRTRRTSAQAASEATAVAEPPPKTRRTRGKAAAGEDAAAPKAAEDGGSEAPDTPPAEAA
jgi:ribonuclease E